MPAECKRMEPEPASACSDVTAADERMGRMVCVEIGVGLDRGLGLSWDQYRELGRHAAHLGYQSVWTNAANGRDPMQVCAQWSVATADVVPGGIGTGISVIPIGYWSPASLASCAATVGEISGGRFVLGVGSGALGTPPSVGRWVWTRAYGRSPRCASGW